MDHRVNQIVSVLCKMWLRALATVRGTPGAGIVGVWAPFARRTSFKVRLVDWVAVGVSVRVKVVTGPLDLVRGVCLCVGEVRVVARRFRVSQPLREAERNPLAAGPV